MNTPIRWNASVSRVAAAVVRPKWAEVRRGLILAAVGYSCLLVFLLPGLFLVWSAQQGGPTEALLGVGTDIATVLGWVLTGIGGGLGGLLLLGGQWRCLSSAPQSHGAKEFAFVCLCASIVVPGCFGVAYFLGGDESVILQGAGGCLGLLSVLLFTGFVWSVAL